MTIIEFLAGLNKGNGNDPNALRFTAVLAGSDSVQLWINDMPSMLGGEIATVMLAGVDVRTVLMKQTAPVRVLRHIERTFPEVPVK